jgi:hypothetical protein
MLYLTKGIGQRTGGDMAEQASHQTAAQQALLQQVTQYISQYTPEPRIISYAPNASGDVMGKFESQKRVFTFRLSNKGLVYKPLVQRKDSESDQDYAVRVDIGSEIYLDRFDAAKAFKPKPSVSIPANKKQRGTKEKPNCSAVSYHCGVCISLGKNCIKNANTAALKERLQKINSLSRMVAKGQAVPQVKTGAIGARVDPASLKKKVNEFVQKQAGGVKSTNPTLESLNALVFSQSADKAIKEAAEIKPSDLKKGQKVKLLLQQPSTTFGNPQNTETHPLTVSEVTPDYIKTSFTNAGGQKVVNKYRLSNGRLPEGTFHPADSNPEAVQHLNQARKLSKIDNPTAEQKLTIREATRLAGESVKKLGIKPNGKKEQSQSEALNNFEKVINEAKTSTKDRQSALRAAAEPNKTTTLSTPLPLTAQSQKRLERGESISDFDTYSVKKEGNKFRVTDPNKFEDEGKLVDKAGLAAHMKELESKPSAVKKSSSMNPVIPINSNPDTMLRALRDGRLIGDAKQGYEIQQRGKDEYLVTTMPNKKGDYSGVMSRKELVEFVKGGGDASKFNKAKDKPVETKKEQNGGLKDKKDLTPEDYAEAKASGMPLISFVESKNGFGVVMTDPKTNESNFAGASGKTRKEAAENYFALFDKTEPKSKGKDDYIPLTSGKNLTPSQKKQSRTADQVAIDRTKSDVSNATKRINTLDDSIKKLKAGSGVMSEADLKKVASLERQKGEWVEQKAKHQAKLERLAKVESGDKNSKVVPPTKKADVKTLQELVTARGLANKPLDVNEKLLPPNLGDYLQSVGMLEKKDGKTFLTKADKNDENSQIFSDFPSFKDAHKSALQQRSENELEEKRNQEFKAQQDKSYRDNRVSMAKQHGERYKNVVESVNELAKKSGDLAINTYTKSFPISSFPIEVDKDGGGVSQIVNGKRQSLTHQQILNLEEQAKASKVKPQTQGTGETEAERRQFLLNTNTEQTNKKPEPKREIELADVKSHQDHIKYATQELAIAKASKDPERINKWIDELQRAKKRSMSQAQVSANTYQPDLFFVNKGNPNQKSIFDSADGDTERNILANIGLMVSRAMTGNQTSPNTVQLRKVKYADGKVSGIFTQYGSQYDFEITNKGVVISPLQVRQDSTVRQDRIAGIAYKKTATIGTNRKCGRGYKCKGSCISKNNKCRVNWATKEGLEQFKSMQGELKNLTNPRFIEIDGRQVAQQRSPEEDAKTLALAKRLAEARGARKEFADESKTKAAKYYKAIGDRVDAKVAQKLKEAGLNVKQVKSTLAELDPKDIAVDPKRFQYKITGEHTASGTVGSLQGVGKWDENLAGILQVWKDPADGKTYVVNGHNRLSKAGELGADKVAVRYLDVPSHQEARTIGAMTNIAEGHGTALDAAKFFRDTNWTKEDVIKKGIPLKEKIATDGLAIASLEANLFRQVIDGDLPMERAAIIGGNGLSHEKQKSLMELLDKRKNVNNSVLSELIDTVKNSGQKQEEQFDLFGNSTATVDLAIQRASLQSYIKQKLGSEKKLFGTVSKSKSAKDLERGGNQIDVDQSSKIADEAATALKMFDTVKHNVGGVSDTLNSASERLAAAKTKAERDKISRETYENVLKNIQQEHDKLFKGTKRSDSRQRIDAGDLGSTAFNAQDQILTYIQDNSGNMMGICQINGVKYRFLKPVFGEIVLTPIADTNLGYLFNMAPDLTLMSQ